MKLIKKRNLSKQQIINPETGSIGNSKIIILIFIGFTVILSATLLGNGMTANPSPLPSSADSGSPQAEGVNPTVAVNSMMQMGSFNPQSSPMPTAINSTGSTATSTSTGGTTTTQTMPGSMGNITVTTQIGGFGFNITLTFTYPANGGPITGSATGACNGPITGTFAGPPTGSISGTASANCSTLGGLITAQGNMTFTGSINSSNTSMNINYNASLSGMNYSGNMQLPLTIVSS